MSDTIKTEQPPEITELNPPAERGFKRLKAYFLRGGSALRHRNYRLFWTGQLVSLIGTWMQNLAQAWLVLSLSNNDPLSLGIVSALQFLPVMLFSLLTGIVADRYPKHKLLLLTQISSMLLAAMLGLLAAFGWVQIWHIYIIAFLLGLVNAFDMPTRQAFISEMVGKKDLMNAVALNSTIFNAARVVGPALAGLLIGLGELIFKSTVAGAAFAIWLNSASYIAVIAGLLSMDNTKLFHPDHQAQEGSIRKRLKEGISYIRHTPTIMALLIIVGMLGTFGFNFNVWIPVLAREHLGVGAEGYGLLMSGLGGGALLSSISLALSGRQPHLRRILVGLICFSGFEAGVALSHWYLLSLVCMIGVGLAMIQVTAASNTMIQVTTPDNLRGRVMSIYMLVFVGTTPIGSFFVGWLGSSFGTPFSMTTGAILSALGAPLVLLGLWRSHRHQKNAVVPADIGQI